MSNHKNTVDPTSTTDPTEPILDGEIVTDDNPTVVQRLRDFSTKHKGKLSFALGAAGTFLVISLLGTRYECEMDVDDDSEEDPEDPEV